MGKLLVQKFGGTSLENAKRIEVVANIIAKTISEGNRVVVVLSAMGEETGRLIVDEYEYLIVKYKERIKKDFGDQAANPSRPASKITSKEYLSLIHI